MPEQTSPAQPGLPGWWPALAEAHPLAMQFAGAVIQGAHPLHNAEYPSLIEHPPRKRDALSLRPCAPVLDGSAGNDSDDINRLAINPFAPVPPAPTSPPSPPRPVFTDKVGRQFHCCSG